MRIWLAGLVVLAGCSAQPPSPPANNVSAENAVADVPVPTPTPAKPSADAPLGEWLVGHWAYEEDCATDFTVVYSADGKLDAHGDIGSWKVEGSEVTETITARTGEAGTEPVDPPETVRYTVEKRGADRGLLRRGTQTQAIRRC
jgi:hypothetical protein